MGVGKSSTERLLALWAPIEGLFRPEVLGGMKIFLPLEIGEWEDMVQSWSYEHTGVFKAPCG